VPQSEQFTGFLHDFFPGDPDGQSVLQILKEKKTGAYYRLGFIVNKKLKMMIW